ncbi:MULTISPECIES: class 1 fructose-bisphosphatase [unclassified Caballeronia]|jgi:fructose-1,6-bisphosphatase I|uniref:class 1 fructose-bisphosphatase n=1 Tax=unclassified Caballeronia TaxID=2646786 RepID=UPI001FD00B8E|nr:MULTISPECIES: class 1 fructose-bisphosphatase [unclassified Caballeronia]MDR5775026.1 class 1 fructose-bisphosphatase [Caballeronia sp. LZ002]MDR5801313.1 class 1 fructose-bisphosphatase [Caballeronia sp. LZ001]MDR5850463.1 class 1 fructose-bisphosphatase [Caballeronia sp. LZ003]
MQDGRTTLSKFLIDTLDRKPGPDAASGLSALLIDVAASIKTIAAALTRGALGGQHGSASSINLHGEEQKKLDLVTNDIFLQHCEWDGLLAGMVSEEMDGVYAIPETYPRGEYLLAFDPLDGSSNIDINGVVGSIFSVLRKNSADNVITDEAAFLQPGREQVAAGYAIYGPATMLVISVGNGTHGFTLERDVGNFVLTHSEIRIPEDSCEFAINASNERFWEPPVRRYVQECKDGRTGCRGQDFNMRWIASMVAEVHRILMRGGVFMYPRDFKTPAMEGRLRLLYEANPMSFLIEQAGGLSTTGRERILDLTPRALHQRVPVILGSRNEVARIHRYHGEHDRGEDKPFSSPLFNERSLFLPETPA